jgi:hypothetical protein
VIGLQLRSTVGNGCKGLQQSQKLSALTLAQRTLNCTWARSVSLRVRVRPLVLDRRKIRDLKRGCGVSWWLAAVAALLCLAALSALGQNTVDLTVLPEGSDPTMAGLYVGTYNASQNGQPEQILSDDFGSSVKPGDSWIADVTSLSSLTNNTKGLEFSGDIAGGLLLGGFYSTVQGYDAMAYLDNEILGLESNTTKNATQIGYLNYAVWAIFDPSQVYNYLKANHDLAIWTQVQSLAEGALKGTYTANEFAGWEIVTVCGTKNCKADPEEFLEKNMTAPEGGSALVYLLVAGIACLGAMRFRSRRAAPNI